MKRIWCLAATVALAAACSGRTTAPDAGTLGGELKILQWKHFVPQYDKWFDPFAKSWGEANGVTVTVDHINLADLVKATNDEVTAGDGHDLIEHVVPPSLYEESVLDMTDVNREVQAKWGEQADTCKKSSFNIVTNKYYALSHGWVPDPGDYRRSLWAQVGMADGPKTYQDLLTAGRQLKALNPSVPVGIGMSKEIDSNMAARAIMWSFGASIQDDKENVVINSPATISAVNYMVQLYTEAMPADVFTWGAATNNVGLGNGSLSYILNSISAYRSAQESTPTIADDIYFTAALTGQAGAFVSSHVWGIYIIPAWSKNPAAAKAFILHLVANYNQAVFNSKLYNFPCFKAAVPQLLEAGGWIEKDPFGSRPISKLAVLKDAEQWTRAVGHPGPANAAEMEVFNTFIIPEMMRKAAQGQMTATQAVQWAEGEIKTIYKKWRDKGLVGGG